MKRFRQFLVGLIAPCRCKVTYSTGNLMEWRVTDASRCQRWGHDDETTCLGSTPGAKLR